MIHKNKHLLVVVVLACSALVLMAVGCSLPFQEREEREGVPSTGMEVDLSISNAPALGETAELTCTVTSSYDATNVTAEIILDDGLELVVGDPVWKGDIAINTPIQGTAADLLKLAMIRVNQAFKDMNLASAMLLSVHDEIVVETPEGEVDLVKDLVKTIMESVWELDVPLKVDVGSGANWAEAH